MYIYIYILCIYICSDLTFISNRMYIQTPMKPTYQIDSSGLKWYCETLAFFWQGVGLVTQMCHELNEL